MNTCGSINKTILINFTLHVIIFTKFGTVKYVDCLPSHWKDELRLGIGHCERNQFIVGDNSWKYLSLFLEIMTMEYSQVNLKEFVGIKMNL